MHPSAGCCAKLPRLTRRGIAVCEVRLSLPNKHHYLVDLAPFGLRNDNEVYLPGDRPYGLIEGTVLADDAPPEGVAWS